LYYESTHWVTGITDGPDGDAWYQITDELWDGFRYYVPAPHLRIIPDDELTAISPDVPPGEKRIEVSLDSQSLSAFEGAQMVFRTQVSTGIPSSTPAGGLPTKTPVGQHNVLSKLPSKHMGAGRLTDTLGDRALPGVPYTMFFAEGGYALHGAYWHNNFGWPMSRGCINLRNSDAKWLFRWVTPAWQPGAVASSADWEVRGLGTRVLVTDN
jgi:lipoprotein-anchoring transpeptidase ErfK/SrfK